jgi:hypothetical protein
VSTRFAGVDIAQGRSDKGYSATSRRNRSARGRSRPIGVATGFGVHSSGGAAWSRPGETWQLCRGRARLRPIPPRRARPPAVATGFCKFGALVTDGANEPDNVAMQVPAHHLARAVLPAARAHRARSPRPARVTDGSCVHAHPPARFLAPPSGTGLGPQHQSASVSLSSR